MSKIIGIEFRSFAVETKRQTIILFCVPIRSSLHTWSSCSCVFIAKCYEIEKNIDAEKKSHKLRTSFSFPASILDSLLLPSSN